MEKNTRHAFYAFLDWSEGKTFNEILGCAKSNIDNLSLLTDVDEYNDKVACLIKYWDVFTDTTCRVEVIYHYKDNLEMINLDDNFSSYEIAHEKGCEELQNGICELLNTTDEDKILEYWNDCVQNSDDNNEYRLYDFDEKNLGDVLEYYSPKDMAKIILTLANGYCDVRERYFYITEDCELHTTNSIWNIINLPKFYDFLTDYIRIEKYGRVWDISNFCQRKSNENEWLICVLPNGTKMYSNNVEGYLVMYENNKVYKSYF